LHQLSATLADHPDPVTVDAGVRFAAPSVLLRKGVERSQQLRHQGLGLHKNTPITATAQATIRSGAAQCTALGAKPIGSGRINLLGNVGG
jgi:hypothetical protein